MTNTFSRTDESLFGRWWWTIDRWMIAIIFSISACGAILALAASPAVAERLNLDTFFFVRRQFIILPLSLMVMFMVSLLNREGIKRLAIVCFVFAFLMMIYTLINGEEIKGAIRWVRFGGLSIQPSEFIKPSFAVIAAWLLSAWRIKDDSPGYLLSIGIYLSVVALLLMQPDVGMAILVSVVWGVQFFLAGLPKDNNNINIPSYEVSGDRTKLKSIYSDIQEDSDYYKNFSDFKNQYFPLEFISINKGRILKISQYNVKTKLTDGLGIEFTDTNTVNNVVGKAKDKYNNLQTVLKDQRFMYRPPPIVIA